VRVTPPAAPFVTKRLTPRAAGDAEARRQLQTEISILDALAGRGAPRLIDAGEDARGPWMRMERIDGRTLAACVRAPREARDADDAHDAHDVQWIARVARGAFAALAEIHGARDDVGPLGIVHGDVSPSNLAVTPDEVVLLDFGLASGARWPRPDGPFRGTILYAAPEIARGSPFDARADLFALGASLLHVASGLAPRAAPSLPAAIAAAAETSIDDWAREAGRPLPSPLAAALARCVAFAPDARPRSAAEALGMW
jgi:eukaryotic-like serine/threonine-protein kinase